MFMRFRNSFREDKSSFYCVSCGSLSCRQKYVSFRKKKCCSKADCGVLKPRDKERLEILPNIYVNLPNGQSEAPALPPRSRAHGVQDGNNEPPPLPPPRVPPTPPRGTTPPPSSSVRSSTSRPNNLPHIMKRMSPAPVPSSRITQAATGVVGMTPQNGHHRGTSPVTTIQSHGPLKAPNSREHAHQIQQQLTAMSLASDPQGYPTMTNGEPPPPPPMTFTSQNPLPPPSYSQTIIEMARRQSPTPSNASSDMRRTSPAPYMTTYPVSTSSIGQSIQSSSYHNPSPIPGTISPASSMMSSSSKTSSMQGWQARQAKTKSPLIMQSAKSQIVQKPVLQSATAVAPNANLDAAAALSQQHDVSSNGRPSPLPHHPPPPYPDALEQKKQQHQPPPASPSLNSESTTSSTQRSTSPVPLVPPAREAHALPPPPPYKSTEVQKRAAETSLVNPKEVPGKPGKQPIICEAKVVQAHGSRTKSIAGGELDPSRTESPLSDCQNFGDSEISSMSSGPMSYTDPDSGVGPSFTENSRQVCESPKPERKRHTQDNVETPRPSLIKALSPETYKFYIEKHIESVIKNYEDRRRRWRQLGSEINTILAEQCQNKEDFEKASEAYRKMLQQRETNYLRMKRAKMKVEDFQKLKKIGEGAFGEVFLVESKHSVHAFGKRTSKGLYALKTLKKSKVVKGNQLAHVHAENDILKEATNRADNLWIVKLFYSFQDSEHLYFVMEYVMGGDLMNLLVKKGIFEESLAKFYIAELVCAVEFVHSMGFIHRDIKPDNILIGADGHIKLTDFGLCTGFKWTHSSKYYPQNGSSHQRQDSMNPGTMNFEKGKCSCAAISSSGMKPLERRKRNQQRCLAHSLVGTPNYIAPEVIQSKNSGMGYTQTCDWWSVGVIFFEMVIGFPPFQVLNPTRPFMDEDAMKRETQLRISNWSQYFNIPAESVISPEARDLIVRLIKSPEERLGSVNGSQDIKNHQFFKDVNFQTLRQTKAPYLPPLTGPTDTSNFDPYPDIEDHERGEGESVSADQQVFFKGFTFRNFLSDLDHTIPDMPPPSQDPVFV